MRADLLVVQSGEAYISSSFADKAKLPCSTRPTQKNQSGSRCRVLRKKTTWMHFLRRQSLLEPSLRPVRCVYIYKDNGTIELTLDWILERLNVRVVQDTYHNPFLLSEQEEEATIKKHQQNLEKLTVPRRPPWDKSMTAEQVQRNERESFLEWRRSMAQYAENWKYSFFCLV